MPPGHTGNCLFRRFLFGERLAFGYAFAEYLVFFCKEPAEDSLQKRGELASLSETRQVSLFLGKLSDIFLDKALLDNG